MVGISLYLNPNFVLISDNIYYSTRKILLIISIPTDIRTYLRLFGEVVLIIGYFLYLEIIVLKWFGLNKNTKKKIFERGLTESISIDINLIEQDDEEPLQNQEGKEKKEDKKLENYEGQKKQLYPKIYNILVKFIN